MAKKSSISRASISPARSPACRQPFFRPEPSWMDMAQARIESSPEVIWDVLEPIVTSTSPPVAFGITQKPTIRRICSGPDRGRFWVCIDVVELEGSEWRSLEFVYARKYLERRSLLSKDALMWHAREQARKYLTGCIGERPRSNGERMICLCFVERDDK